MKADARIRSSDVLGSLEMTATIRIPARVISIVRARLWLATQIIRLGALVGGVSVVIDDGDDAGG